MAKESEGEVTLKHHEIVYRAANDSLSIVEFTSSVDGWVTETMYFAYVVADDGDDYWVLLENNPVNNAMKFNDNINSITSRTTKEPNDELIYSTIRLNCSLKYAKIGRAHV